MATVNVQGTEFTLSVLPLRFLSKGYYARTEIRFENEHIRYRSVSETIVRECLENWIFSMFRIVAGGFEKETTLRFDRAGLAVDFYPYVKEDGVATREERRNNECVMAIRFLMRAKDKREFLGGVHSVLLRRKEILTFATELKEEFDAVFSEINRGKGKYLFVGVSPWGYKGCNYWYLDPTGKTQAGDYVWVRMGKHNLEQIVYVDGVRYFDADTAPYDPDSVKRILRKATPSEFEEWTEQARK